MTSGWFKHTVGKQKRQGGEPLWPEKPQKKADEYIDAFLFSTFLVWVRMYGEHLVIRQ